MIDPDSDLYKAHDQRGREGLTAEERNAQRDNRAFRQTPEGAKLAALEARIAAVEQNPVKAGQGIDVKGPMVSLQGATGGGATGGGATGGVVSGALVQFDVWENGVFVQYDIPASNRRVLGS